MRSTAGTYVQGQPCFDRLAVRHDAEQAPRPGRAISPSSTISTADDHAINSNNALCPFRLLHQPERGFGQCRVTQERTLRYGVLTPGNTHHLTPPSMMARYAQCQLDERPDAHSSHCQAQARCPDVDDRCGCSKRRDSSRRGGRTCKLPCRRRNRKGRFEWNRTPPHRGVLNRAVSNGPASPHGRRSD